MKTIPSWLAAIWSMAVFLGLAADARAYTLVPSGMHFPATEGPPGTIHFILPWDVTGTPADGTVDYTLTTDPPSPITQSGTIIVTSGPGAGATGISLVTSYANLPAAFFDIIVTPTSASSVTVASSYRIPTIIPPDLRRTLTVSGGTLTEGNAGTSDLTFTVTLNRSIGSAVTFLYTTEEGTAQAGVDFQPTTGTGTIPASGLSTLVSISVNGDIDVEDNETLLIRLGSFSVFMTEAAGTPGTILTDDFPPALLQQSGTSVTVTEDAGGVLRAALPFQLHGTLLAGASVNYSLVSAPDARLGRTGVMSLSAGTTAAQTIDLPFSYHELPGEDFHIIVTPVQVNSPPGQAPVLSALSSYDFTVHFDGVRILTVSGGSVPEGNAGTALLPFTIALHKAAGAPLTFTWSTVDGTAVAGEDYTAATGTGTIPAGDLTTTVHVSVKGDAAVEYGETLSLALSAFSVAVKPGAVSPGTILPDDFSAGPVPSATMVTEASGTDTVMAWFAVNLPAARNGPMTCRVATRNGTAVAGADYRALTATDITFAAGETLKWVAVTVTASSAVEGREEFFLDVEALDSHEVNSAACAIERLAVTAFSRAAANIYQIRFPGGLGQRYLVEESDSLTGVWTPASGLLSGAGAPLMQLMFSESTKGFFRVRTSSPLAPGTAAASS